MHQVKACNAHLKTRGKATVSGYAATFDREQDSYGDVIAPGAFQKTLEHWEQLNREGKYIPLLYNHSTEDPAYNIGRVVEAKEDERGLFIVAEFDTDNEKAEYVRKLVKEGRIYQFSFAYDVNDHGEVTLDDGTKANEIRDVDVFEISLVQIPANPHATVEEVKSMKKSGRRNSRKDEGQLQDLADALEAAENIAEEQATQIAEATEELQDATEDAEVTEEEAAGLENALTTLEEVEEDEELQDILQEMHEIVADLLGEELEEEDAEEKRARRKAFRAYKREVLRNL